MLAQRFCVQAIGIISVMILARLLTPDDFGLIALASSVYAVVELIRAFGFDVALIQKQHAGREHYNSAWTLQICFSLIASLGIVAVSGLVASFYGDPRLKSVLSVMAIIIIVNGFNNIGIVEFRKKLFFSKEFSYQVLVKISGFIVTVPCAFYLRSYWALLAGMCSVNIASLVLSYAMQNYRPRVSLSAWKDLLGFSSWLFVNNILLFLNQHGLNFFIGKFAGSTGLGLFSISHEIATITTTQIIAPINRAVFPGYAIISNNKEALKDTYLKVLSQIVLIAAPSAVGIAAIAPIIVPVLLGEKWLASIAVIQLLALSSVLMSINTNAGYVYIAIGKQQFTTMMLFIRLSITLPLVIILSSQEGAVGAAKAIFIASLLVFPLDQALLRWALKLSWKELFGIMYRPVISAAIMGACLYMYSDSVHLEGFAAQGIWHLIFATLIGVFIFISILTVFWYIAGKPQGAEKWAFDFGLNAILGTKKQGSEA